MECYNKEMCVWNVVYLVNDKYINVNWEKELENEYNVNTSFCGD